MKRPYKGKPCAVCGVDTERTRPRGIEHRCSKRACNRIDREDQEAWDRELDPTRYEDPEPTAFEQTLEGLLILEALR